MEPGRLLDVELEGRHQRVLDKDTDGVMTLGIAGRDLPEVGDETVLGLDLALGHGGLAIARDHLDPFRLFRSPALRGSGQRELFSPPDRILLRVELDDPTV